MQDLDVAGFAFMVGLINGVFAIFTGSILFGTIGPLFALSGFYFFWR